MYRRVIYIFVVVFLFGFTNAVAQKNSIKLSADEIENYKEQSKMMISYLEGTLNFLGDPNEVVAEKEIIFNESYLKIFRDAEVQIEDDLDANREVPLRKNVQAYLKDIMFFYKQVQFVLEVSSVEQIVNEQGEIVFKVTVNRNLKGITVNNDTVDNNMLRYVEINLDPLKTDLRIVSIYSTKPNAKEEMRYWWSNLPLPWKDFMGKGILVFDTLPMNKVASFEDSTAVIMKTKSVVETDSLLISNGDTLRFSKLPELKEGDYQIVYSYDTVLQDYPDTVEVNCSELDSYLKTLFNTKYLRVKNNYLISTLDPLSRMNNLEKVTITNMLVNDLSPLRNLSKLTELDISSTMVKDLSPLRFMFNLKVLDVSKTYVDSLNALQGLTLLEKLNIDSTKVTDLTPLSGLENLVYLNLSRTQVTNLQPIGNLRSLKTLVLDDSQVEDLTPLKDAKVLESISFDNTNVSDLNPLGYLPALKIIQANHSLISTLKPLENSTGISRIYCDHTGIKRDEALAFMEKHPGCLVIFDSQRLINWWESLSDEWKSILSDGYPLSNPPTKDEIQKIVIQKEVNISNNSNITSLKPLEMLFKLEKLNLSHTKIEDLSPLAMTNNLQYLDMDYTPVTGLQALSALSNLKEVHFEYTAVTDLMPLTKSNRLEIVYCDSSKVNKEQVIKFKSYNPGCLIVYQTEDLTFWWNSLSDEWQKELLKQIDIDESPSKEQLQQIVDLESVTISNNNNINDLEPLNIFYLLRNLSVSFTAVSDLSPLAQSDSLRVLVFPNNPIVDISPLANLINLQELNLENTGIDDLSPLAGLTQLEVLNLAGTKVKKLKPLVNLVSLRELTINNTKVNRLTDVGKLPSLEKLICYNTFIKKKKVDAYKASHPEVEVVYY